LSTVARPDGPVSYGPVSHRPGSPGPVPRRGVRRGVVALGVAAVLTLACAGTATAAPSAPPLPPAIPATTATSPSSGPAAPLTVEQAEAQLDAVYRRAEVAAEAVNDAVTRAGVAASDLAVARAAAAAQQRTVDQMQTVIGNQAAATYRGGGLGLTTRLLLSDDADQFLRTLSTTRVVQDGQLRRLGSLQQGTARLEAERDRVAGAVRTADGVTARRTAEKTELDREVAAAQVVLRRLTASQQVQITARTAAAATADRAQARTLLAAADAELRRPAGTDSTPPATAPPGTAAVPGYDATGTGGAAADGSNSRLPTGGSDDSVPDIGLDPDSTSQGKTGVALPVVANEKIAAVLAFAAAQLGDTYVWGATGPDSFDCSGLVLRAWQQAGVTLPRTSAVQFAAGRRVAPADLRPGDLVFFYSPVSHVGLYIGGGKMINASNPRTGVKVSNVFTSAYAGAVRPG